MKQFCKNCGRPLENGQICECSQHSSQIKSNQNNNIRQGVNKYHDSSTNDIKSSPNKGALKSKTKRNRLSVIAFILSLFSVIGIGLAGLVSIVLGIIALVQIKNTKEPGMGFAIAAIIIGVLFGIVASIARQLV